METRKANAKFVSSIAAQEKLKSEFDAEWKAWAEEKAALVTRAEQAEKALTEKTAELSGLKRQVSQMVAAIFGKSPHRLSSSLKSEFDAEWKAWAEEKAALVTRAEQAEKALTEKTAELSGLKRQVSQMVAAIFGKSPHRLSSSLHMLRFTLVTGLPDLY